MFFACDDRSSTYPSVVCDFLRYAQKNRTQIIIKYHSAEGLSWQQRKPLFFWLGQSQKKQDS